MRVVEIDIDSFVKNIEKKVVEWIRFDYIRFWIVNKICNL